MKQKEYKTINTFTQIPSIAQIFAYCVVIMEIAVFYAAIQPNFTQQHAFITFHVLFAVSLAFQIIFTLICSVIDPTDSFVINMGSSNQQLKKQTQKQILQMNQHFFCSSCNQWVQKRSRHCKTCHRCVQQFDHHCMWINNCIGGKNYKCFIIMLVGTFTHILIFIASVVFLTAQGTYHQQISSFAVSWVAVVILLILEIALANLIVLHIYLAYKGITTYQLIIRNKQDDKKVQKNQKNKVKMTKIIPVNQTNFENQQCPNSKQLNQNTNQDIHIESEKQQNQLDFECHDFEQNSNGKSNFSNKQKADQVKHQSKQYQHLFKGGTQSRQVQRDIVFFHAESSQKTIDQENPKNNQQFSRVQNYLKTNRSLRLMVGKRQNVSEAQPISKSLCLRKLSSERVNKNNDQK